MSNKGKLEYIGGQILMIEIFGELCYFNLVHVLKHDLKPFGLEGRVFAGLKGRNNL